MAKNNEQRRAEPAPADPGQEWVRRSDVRDLAASVFAAVSAIEAGRLVETHLTLAKAKARELVDLVRG